MSIYWNHNIYEELDKLLEDIASVNTEEIEREVMKRTASDIAKMVRQTAFESEMRGRNQTGGYKGSASEEKDRNDGPSLISSDAWQVVESGDTYLVRPHPKVAERAEWQNYGGGPISADDGGVMVFRGKDGEKVFRMQVSGPNQGKGYHFWEQAIGRAKQQNVLEENATDVVNEALEEAGLK